MATLHKTSRRSNHDYIARLYFEDECPRIGCGWREVSVKEGDKWAHLTEVATGRRQRIPVDTFDRLRWWDDAT